MPKKRKIPKKKVLKKKKTSKRKKKGEKFQTKEATIVILAIAVLALSLQILISSTDLTKISAQLDEDKNFRDTQTDEIISPEKIDFPSTEEGTLSGWMEGVYPKEPIDKEIVLFSSAKIPGLAIVYYHEENKLIAGTPKMNADGITLFDGEKHHLAYTFKRGGPQILFYDGQQVAASEFQHHLPTSITGMVTGPFTPIISKTFSQININ